MNFGLLFPFRNPPQAQVPFPELYRKHFDLTVKAEELGYDTVWLTEHHFVEDGYSPSLLPIAAAIAARTKKIRIGTFVLLAKLGRFTLQRCGPFDRGRMGREESCSRGLRHLLGHPLHHSRGSLGIVPRVRGVAQPDLIRLTLLVLVEMV